MCLVFHVTTHDHLTEGLWEFAGGSSFRYVTTLISLVIIGVVIVEMKILYYKKK